MTRVATQAVRTVPCRQCGNCCRVEGYVRLHPSELESIARHLGVTVDTLTRDYTRLTNDRRGLSLTEKPDGSCVFLDPENRCRIQAAKPRQCRAFPQEWTFAGYEAICEAAKECQT